MKSLFIFGDSIVYGAWDRELGWTSRIKKEVDQRIFNSNFEEYVHTYSLGVSGDTSEDVLQRFVPEMERRIAEVEERCVIFSVGINDTCVDTKNGQPQVEQQAFAANMAKLIQEAKKFAPTVICMGLTPIEDTKLNPIPWFTQLTMRQNLVEEYDSILQEICKENDGHYIPLLGELDYPDLEDGLHPNTQGHEKIYTKVKKFLEESNII